MKKIVLASLVVSVVLLLSVANGAWDPRDKTGAENKEVDETISRFLKEDPIKKGQFELSAQASAVAVKEGVGKAGSYTNGIAIFILPKGGLMAEVSIGGQRTSYEPF